MGEGADVIIRYSFLPTETSIREGVERVTKQFNRVGGNSFSSASAKKIKTESDKTVDLLVNFLRMTQQKTSLQTKLMAGMKLGKEFFGLGGEKAPKTAEEMYPAGSTIMGGAKEAAAGAGGGGMMGALGSIVGLLTVISVAMMLIGAFFEAVGPIIKVVVKMIGAMILILLMPFLKRGLPILFGILKAMIDFSKTISNFVDAFLTYIEGALGEVMTGNPMGLIKLWLGPIGFVALEIFKLLSKVDWNAVILAIIPIIEAIFETGKNIVVGIISTLFGTEFGGKVKAILDSIQRALFSDNPDFWGRIKDVINTIGTTIFGEETWNQIKAAIKFVQDCLNPTGMWEKIKGVINYIGESIFGKETWGKIKDVLSGAFKLITSVLQSAATALQQIVAGLVEFWNASAFGFLFPATAPTDILGDQEALTNSLKDLTTTMDKAYEQLNQQQTSLTWLLENYVPPPAKTGDTYRYTPGVDKPVKQDFISRPGMGIQSFSPNDTIIGTKGGMGGGQTINNYLTVSAGVDKSEFRKILSDFNREQARELRMRTSYSAGIFA